MREDLREMEAELNRSIIAGYGGSKKYKPGSNHASKIGHPCMYYLWARRARWKEIPPIDDVKQGIFAIGREHEKAVSAILNSEGWNVTKTQASFHHDKLDIGAKMDFELSHDLKPLWKDPVPTEFKSCSNTYFDTINSFDDLFLCRVKWVRLWPVQALTYGWLDEVDHPLVAVLLRNKITGAPKTLITETIEHGEMFDALTEKLTVVNECLEADVEAPTMEFCPMWCPECECKHICPAMQSMTIDIGVHVLKESTRLDASADVWASTKDNAKMNADAWKDINATVEALGAKKGPAHTETTLVGRRWRYTARRTAKRCTVHVERIA